MKYPVNEGKIGLTFKEEDPIWYPKEREHTGIDIKPTSDTNIYSVSSGEVVAAGFAEEADNNFGNYVVVRLADGVHYLTYCHLNTINEEILNAIKRNKQISESNKTEEEKRKAMTPVLVKKGTILGEMGQTGRGSGIHLHFEVRVMPKGSTVDHIDDLWLDRFSNAEDPMSYIVNKEEETIPTSPPGEDKGKVVPSNRETPTVTVLRGSVEEQILREQYGNTINLLYAGINQFVGRDRIHTNSLYKDYIKNKFGVLPVNEIDDWTKYESKKASTLDQIKDSLMLKLIYSLTRPSVIVMKDSIEEEILYDQYQHSINFEHSDSNQFIGINREETNNLYKQYLFDKYHLLPVFDVDLSKYPKDKTGNNKTINQYLKELKGHSTGLPLVPEDNYPALLHEGESVLTKRETSNLQDLFDRISALEKKNRELNDELTNLKNSSQDAIAVTDKHVDEIARILVSKLKQAAINMP